MALRIKPTSTLKIRSITTLIAMFALVAQPLVPVNIPAVLAMSTEETLQSEVDTTLDTSDKLAEDIGLGEISFDPIIQEDLVEIPSFDSIDVPTEEQEHSNSLPDTTSDINTFAAPVIENIQDAIDSAEENSTITLPEGTFTESLNITKSLTIIGAGEDKTLIKAPQTAINQGSLVTISGSGVKVSISNLTIDGLGYGYSTDHAGVHIKNGADANLNNINIKNITHTEDSGRKTAVNAVLVGGGVPRSSGTATITDVDISNYYRGGMYIIGEESFANVLRTTITAPTEPLSLTNGMSLQYGGNVKLVDSRITGNLYLGEKWSGAGITIWDEANNKTVISNTTITQNTVGLSITEGTNPSVLENLDISKITDNKQNARVEIDKAKWTKPENPFYTDISGHQKGDILKIDGNTWVVGYNYLQDVTGPILELDSSTAHIKKLEDLRFIIKDSSGVQKSQVNILDSEGNRVENLIRGGTANNAIPLVHVKDNIWKLDLEIKHFTTKTLPEGEYTFKGRSVDNLGNPAYSQWTNPVKIDTTAPKILATTINGLKPSEFKLASLNNPKDGILNITITTDEEMNASGKAYMQKILHGDDNLNLPTVNFKRVNSANGRFIYSADIDLGHDLLKNKYIEGMQFRVKLYDKIGNTTPFYPLRTNNQGGHDTSEDVFRFNLDNKAPVITLSNEVTTNKDNEGNATPYYKDARKVTVDISEDNLSSNTFVYKKSNDNGADKEVLSFDKRSFTLGVGLPEGSYYIVHTDKAGNMSEKSYFVIANQKPAINNISLPRIIGLKGSTLSYSLSNNSGTEIDKVLYKIYEYSANGDNNRGKQLVSEVIAGVNLSNTSIDFEQYVETLGEGKYVIQLQARNIAHVHDTHFLEFDINTRNPELALSTEDLLFNSTKEVLLSGTANALGDNNGIRHNSENNNNVGLPHVRITFYERLDGGGVKPIDSQIARVLEDGTWKYLHDEPATKLFGKSGNYRLVVKAYDRAGLSSSEANSTQIVRDFSVDIDIPTVEEGIYDAVANTLRFSLDDEDVELFEITINNIVDTPTVTRDISNPRVWVVLIPSGLKPGEYTYEATATDRAGNIGTTTRNSDNGAVFASFTIDTPKEAVEEEKEEKPSSSSEKPADETPVNGQPNPNQNLNTPIGITPLAAGSLFTPQSDNSFLAFANTTDTATQDTDGVQDDESEVLGATTQNNNSSKDDDGEVLGASTEEDGSLGLFGMAWYWWTLILVAVVSIISLFLSGRKRTQEI